jgi:cell division protein FtsB
MIPLPALSTAISVLAGITGFAAGYAFEHRARVAEVAQIRADIARREATAAEESRRRIETALKAADAAIAQRDARIAELDATTRRLRHDIKTATTGRPCLSPAARSLLHDSPAFGLRLPATPGGAIAAPAAPATDSRIPSPPGRGAGGEGRGAGGEGNIPSPSGRGTGGEGDTTDTDLAGWILDAASLYEACRARIDALRQWDEVTHGR